MINILLCGNEKVFDGALTQSLSITNKTKEIIHWYILTMDVSRIKPEYTCITEEQIQFLNKVVKSKHPENQVTRIDITNLYETEFGKCKNEGAYCTPYTLLRLFADVIPEIPDKILYLDIDMMAKGDISELYHTNISNYEYATVKEKYGSIFIWPDYINAGMLLLNIKKIKETKLLEKARHLIKTKKMLFADQDAIYRSTTQKLLLPRKYNEQSSFKREDTIICHFCKRLMLLPYPHTENYKQWQIDDIHRELKCYAFEDDLQEYVKLKQKFEEEKGEKENETRNNTNLFCS
ncbi:MAG: lipopolysaccharide biosynthesis protein [Clostridia bacterium]|nr:lipopolysaccharide biosynthesis protein [Clostridia bacterium]